MNIEDKTFKRCKSPLCSNVIYYYQNGTESDYCCTDCLEDVNLQKRIENLRKSKKDKEEKTKEFIVDWDSVQGLVFPHTKYNTDLII